MSSISIEVTTVGTATNLYLRVYSDLNGAPNSYLFGSTFVNGATTVGIKTYSYSYQFIAGNLYWLALNSDGAATLRSISVGSSMPIQSTAGTNIYSAFSVPLLASQTNYPGGTITLHNLGTVDYTVAINTVP
jgi:hypothetical protein